MEASVACRQKHVCSSTAMAPPLSCCMLSYLYIALQCLACMRTTSNAACSPESHLNVDCCCMCSLGHQSQPYAKAKHGASCTVVEGAIQHGCAKQQCQHHCTCYASVMQRQKEEEGCQTRKDGAQTYGSLLRQSCTNTILLNPNILP